MRVLLFTAVYGGCPTARLDSRLPLCAQLEPAFLRACSIAAVPKVCLGFEKREVSGAMTGAGLPARFASPRDSRESAPDAAYSAHRNRDASSVGVRIRTRLPISTFGRKEPDRWPDWVHRNS